MSELLAIAYFHGIKRYSNKISHTVVVVLEGNTQDPRPGFYLLFKFIWPSISQGVTLDGIQLSNKTINIK